MKLKSLAGGVLLLVTLPCAAESAGTESEWGVWFQGLLNGLTSTVHDPEPSALILAGLGMAAIMWRRCTPS